jgi:hypothetical protein
MASIFYAYKVQIHGGHFLNPSFVSHKPRKFRTNIVSLNFSNRQMEPPLVYGNLCAKKIMSQTTLSVETSCTHTLSTFAWVCVCVCVCLSLSLSRIVFYMHLFQDTYMKFKSHQWLGHFTYWQTSCWFFFGIHTRSDIILWAHPFRILSPRGNGLSEVGSRP